MFGFTGTQSLQKMPLKSVQLKIYLESATQICDYRCYRDQNVLRFAIEYVGRYKQKEDSKTNIDIEVGYRY